MEENTKGVITKEWMRAIIKWGGPPVNGRDLTSWRIRAGYPEEVSFHLKAEGWILGKRWEIEAGWKGFQSA